MCYNYLVDTTTSLISTCQTTGEVNLQLMYVSVICRTTRTFPRKPGPVRSLSGACCRTDWRNMHMPVRKSLGWPMSIQKPATQTLSLVSNKTALAHLGSPILLLFLFVCLMCFSVFSHSFPISSSKDKLLNIRQHTIFFWVLIILTFCWTF